MGFKSFRNQESQAVVTLPNLITFGRGFVGGVLGISMARYNLDPAFVAASASALAASDAEGSLIGATARWPRLQKLFRIVPSSLGRIADPVADKIFAMSVFVGGVVSGAIPELHGAGILATEGVTTAATLTATAKGHEIEVTTAGKMGMVARCATIGADLTAAAVEPGFARDLFENLGHVSAVTAVMLGSVSCYQVIQRVRTNTARPA